jgi:hypothetical protein
MPRGSSAKRERQYKHIESSAKERGASSGRAKEIAARTVNKQRAQSGEATGSSKGSSGKASSSKGSSSSSNKSSSRSTRGSGGGSSSGGSSSRSPSSSSRSSSSSSGSNTTFRQLYAEAQRRDIKGRSSMDKAQLERALAGGGGKRSR